MNFTYTLREPVDGAWGSLQDDGTWNGMVRHLQDHVADIGKRITIVFINTVVVTPVWTKHYLCSELIPFKMV